MFELKTEYDKKPLPRYIDFTFDHFFIKKGLINILNNKKYLIIVCHPSLLFDKIKRNNHLLLKFGTDNFIKNVKFLKIILEKLNYNYTFVTLKELSENTHEI